MKLSYIALAAFAAALLSNPAQAQADVVKRQLDGVVAGMAERRATTRSSSWSWTATTTR
jgi:hypothetical protein